MFEILAEWWVQIGLALCIACGAWVAARAVRAHAPYLLESTPGRRTSVQAGSDGISLHDGREKMTMSWREIALVRVRTTAEGPFSEDLFLECEPSSGSPLLRIPGEADGFADLLEVIGTYLPGFDMDEMVEAIARMEDSESVVWRRR